MMKGTDEMRQRKARWITGMSLAGTLALLGCAKPAVSVLPNNPQALEQLASHGNAVAANLLGVMYANGNGVPQDFSAARKWYLFASEHGNPAGEFNLALAYQRGLGTPVDMPTALRWYELAASHNYAPAKLSLGILYLNGNGVTRDKAEAVRLIRASAIDGFPFAQIILAGIYGEGVDVPPDDGIAYEWASLAASKLVGIPQQLAQRERDGVAKSLNPAELTVAQAATAQWKPGTDLVSPIQPGSGPHPLRMIGMGSGFIVGKDGQVATDFHVVPNCKEVRLKDAAGKFNNVSHVVASDRDDDVALIAGAGFGTRLKLGDGQPRLGETVITYGFPLGPMLSSTGNMTTGSISSMAGPQNDAKQFQITAPVQVGSSGGPVIDETGAVIGIVQSKLNVLAVAASTGDVVQNVNFARRTGALKALLENHGIMFDSAGKTGNKSMTELADELQKATVNIECWR
jgi:hypothetical protein